MPVPPRTVVAGLAMAQFPQRFRERFPGSAMGDLRQKTQSEGGNLQERE